MNRTELLLTVLSEECAEVSQRACKAQRFGLKESQVGQGLTNAQRIVREYADLQAAVEMLVENGDLELVNMRAMIDEKKAKVEGMMKYSEECGALQVAGV